MFFSLTKSPISVILLKATRTLQPVEHKTQKTTGCHLQENVYNRSQAAWLGKVKTSPGNRRSLLVYCWKSGLAFHMEMVLLGLWIDFSHLHFLVTSCSMSSLFLYQCHRRGYVALETYTHHPLSQTYRLYIAEKGARGCLTSLFFWTEVVGSLQMWYHCRGNS